MDAFRIDRPGVCVSTRPGCVPSLPSLSPGVDQGGDGACGTPTLMLYMCGPPWLCSCYPRNSRYLLLHVILGRVPDKFTWVMTPDASPLTISLHTFVFCLVIVQMQFRGRVTCAGGQRGVKWHQRRARPARGRAPPKPRGRRPQPECQPCRAFVPPCLRRRLARPGRQARARAWRQIRLCCRRCAPRGLCARRCGVRRGGCGSPRGSGRWGGGGRRQPGAEFGDAAGLHGG